MISTAFESTVFSETCPPDPALTLIFEEASLKTRSHQLFPDSAFCTSQPSPVLSNLKFALIGAVMPVLFLPSESPARLEIMRDDARN